MEYKKRLVEHPVDIELIKGMVLLKAVTDGKDEAVEVTNEQIKMYPRLSTELSHELLFYQFFNRDDYVFRRPTVTNLDK